MIVRTLTAACIIAAGLPAAALAQRELRAPTPLPEVKVTAPAVIAFWLVPGSDSVLEADPGLASALDEHQYYWSDTRTRLAAAGISALDQPGRRFVVREPGRRWTFTAAPDSTEIGFLFVQPGRKPHALYGRHFPDEVLALARDYFRLPLPK